MCSLVTPGASDEKTWKRSTRRSCIPSIKALCLPVSDRKNFEVCLLCSYVHSCDPQGRGRHHMDKFGIGPQGDAMYQISTPFSFREELKISFFVPMLQLVTAPGRDHF